MLTLAKNRSDKSTESMSKPIPFVFCLSIFFRYISALLSLLRNCELLGVGLFYVLN